MSDQHREVQSVALLSKSRAVSNGNFHGYAEYCSYAFGSLDLRRGGRKILWHYSGRRTSFGPQSQASRPPTPQTYEGGTFLGAPTRRTIVFWE